LADWVQGEPFGFISRSFAYELVGREAFESLEPSPEVTGGDEVSEMGTKLIVVVVMQALTVASLIVRFTRSTWPSLGKTSRPIVL